MKVLKFKRVLPILILLLVSTGAIAYARQPMDTKPGANENANKELHDKYHRLSRELLLEKLGITKEEAAEARAAGKKLYELAKDKGISMEQLRTAMYEAKIEAIEQAIKNGDMTKEEGNSLIVKMKERMEEKQQTKEEMEKENKELRK